MAESEHDKRVKSQVEHKLADQRQREFLSDKSKGGGPNMPRPTQSYIDASIPPKSDAQIWNEGNEKVWREDLDRDASNKRAKEIASKMEGRRAPEPEPKKSSFLDRWKPGKSEAQVEKSADRSQSKKGPEIGD
jgi:hypothetical protein